jgi:hypothetical protein
MRREPWRSVLSLVGVVALPAALAASQAASQAGQATPAAAATGPARLDGAWVLNRQQSTSIGGGGDAGHEGGGHRRGGFSGGFGRPGGGMGRGAGGGSEDREAMERQRALVRELLEPLPRITVTSDAESITFTVADGRVRKYRLDGKKEKHQFDNGTVDTKSKWENDRLTIETSTSGGTKLVETYSVNDQHQLVIEASFEGGRRGDRAPIVHVYDDASLQ